MPMMVAALSGGIAIDVRLLQAAIRTKP